MLGYFQRRKMVKRSSGDDGVKSYTKRQKQGGHDCFSSENHHNRKCTSNN